MGKIILYKVCLNSKREGKMLSVDLNRYSAKQNTRKDTCEIDKNKGNYNTKYKK